MALCTSDEAVTEKARDSCLTLMQVDRDDTSTCKWQRRYRRRECGDCAEFIISINKQIRYFRDDLL